MPAPRQFLSRILKRFVPEYEHIPLCDIESDLIEPGSIKVGQVSVERNLSNIEGLSNEDKTLNEGNIYYDIVFSALYPKEEGRYIGMYINLEMQQDMYPVYEIETRGFYYAARRFSSQKLFTMLRDQGKKDELEKAVFDPEYKKQLYRLYNIT